MSGSCFPFCKVNSEFSDILTVPSKSPVREEKFVVGDENYSVRDDNSYVKWRFL